LRVHTLVLVSAAAVLWGGCTRALAEPGNRLDFDAAQQVAAMAFHDGGEYPGSSGAFEAGEGVDGAGGRLAFSFSCNGDDCGRYVSATWTPAEPLAAGPSDYFVFDYKPAAGARLALRLVDESGQTFQLFPREETLKGPTEDGWRRIEQQLAVEGEVEHWGGKNSGRVEGRIVEVTFMAQGLGRPASGALGFDNVEAVDVARLPPLRASLSAPLVGLRDVPPPEISIAAHNLRDWKAYQMARDAGARAVRIDHAWGEVVRGKGFDHGFYNDFVERLDAMGLATIIIVDRGWHYQDGPAIGTERHRREYLRYVTDLARNHRGQNVVLEIFNEPDTNTNRYAAPEQFAREILATVKAARAGDPNVKLITGGLSWANPGYVDAMLRGLAAEPGVARHLSGFGIHLYRLGPFETAAADAALLRRLMRRHLGRELPLWVTEWGYSTTFARDDKNGHAADALATQAAMLPRVFLTLWGMGAPYGTWYDLHDNGTDPREKEHNFGLLTQSGKPKPALSALSAFARIAEGRRLAGFAAETPPTVHAARLQGAAGDVLAVWTDAPQARGSVEASPAEFRAVRNARGEERALVGSEPVLIPLRVADGPVYLIAR
jgi:polysaccharide biosynthesis protein PslG